jgi:hypothetical protein
MLFIDAPDALERLAAIEGEAWKADQLARPDSPFGFHTYLRVFRELVQSNSSIDGPIGHLVAGGDCAIYGNGGYSRYVVLSDGEVVLLAWSIEHRAEKRSSVQLAGVRISDEPKRSTRVVLPRHVREHVQHQLATLDILARARQTDRKFCGGGRYEAETYEHHRAHVDRAWKALAYFDELCRTKGLDPDAVYAELGQPGRLSDAAQAWLRGCSPAPELSP